MRTSPDAAFAKRGAALRTVPALRERLVSRTALVNRLRTESAQLVTLVAPAGYGKTTLLTQWALRDTRTFAWLGLEAEDDDPKQLRALIATAVAESTGEDEPSSDLLDSRTSTRTFARRLGRTLLAHRTQVVFVLDGADQLRSKRTLSFVAELCDLLPPGVQVAFAARALPALPFARWRAEGRLAELGGELALTDREAATLLHNEGVELAATATQDLNDRVEGWAAGLYLTALALQPRRARPQRDSAGIRGDHHFVSEYLESEVFDSLEEDELDFAACASILDRMAGPLCDAVIGASGSAARLRHLAEEGAFLVPLDRERTSFRFHRFVRDALAKRLEQWEPARYAELHRRAAAWYEQAGDVSTAIRHARAIDDGAEVARLLGNALDDVCGRGLVAGLQAAVEGANDTSAIGDNVPAAVSGALVRSFLGDAADASRWAATAFAAVRSPERDPRTALLRAAMCQEGVERMHDDAARAVAHLDARSPLSPFAMFLVGVSNLLTGNHTAAELAFDEAAEAAAAVDAPLVQMLALAELSLIAQASQDWGRGEELARAARDAADNLADGDHVATALAYVASARSALRHSNWVRAEEDIERVHDLLPVASEALPWLAVQVRLELMRAHLALNGVAEVDELASDVERLLAARPHLGVFRDDARSLARRVESVHDHVEGPASTLTAAELRLLPLLTTHLTFRQIAQHLYVSRNTIKTQAISVYRKLGVSSRTEAIERAVELGLLRPDSETVERSA